MPDTSAETIAEVPAQPNGGAGAQIPPRLRPLLIVLGCLLGLAVDGLLKWPALPYIVGGDNDFMCFYSAGQLAGSGKLYDAAAIGQAESRLWEIPRFLPYTRLPFYAAMLTPLRLFSYRHAYWIWQLGALTAVILFVWFWPGRRRWMAAMACCWSAPLLDCFIMGRDLAVLLPVLAVSLALLWRGRHFAAGCVFSLCLIKYNLFLAFPLLIVGRRLWRFSGGIVAGGAVLGAVSFAVGGWSWPWQYVATLQWPSTTPRYCLIPNLHGLFSSLPPNALLEAVATCVVLLATWLIIRRGDFALAVAGTLLSGLLISYHAFFGDALLMVPVSLLLLSRPSTAPLRMTALLMLFPLTYLPFLLPAQPFPPALVMLVPLVVMTAEALRRESPPALTPAAAA